MGALSSRFLDLPAYACENRWMSPELQQSLRAQISPIDWLRLFYNERRAKNAAFSLRSFAKLLQIPSGRLTEILSGKRPITARMAEHLSERLDLLPEDTQLFCDLAVAAKLKAVPVTVLSAESPDRHSRQGASHKQLTSDSYYVLADWYHQAIMSLVKTADFVSDPDWIAARLGITTIEVRTAIDRLKRLHFLKEIDGELIRGDGSLTITHEGSSSAARRVQKQWLEKALASLENGPDGQSECTTSTLVISPEQLPRVRSIVAAMRQELNRISDESRGNALYQLSVQVVPVSKVEVAE